MHRALQAAEREASDLPVAKEHWRRAGATLRRCRGACFCSGWLPSRATSWAECQAPIQLQVNCDPVLYFTAPGHPYSFNVSLLRFPSPHQYRAPFFKSNPMSHRASSSSAIIRRPPKGAAAQPITAAHPLLVASRYLCAFPMGGSSLR